MFPKGAIDCFPEQCNCRLILKNKSQAEETAINGAVNFLLLLRSGV